MVIITNDFSIYDELKCTNVKIEYILMRIISLAAQFVTSQPVLFESFNYINYN